MSIVITGATGLTGSIFLQYLAKHSDQKEINCLVRSTSNRTNINQLNLKLNYYIGDSSTVEAWDNIFNQLIPETIIHLAQLCHVPALLTALAQVSKKPHLIIIGTTGIYSRYNEYSQEYKNAEDQLQKYKGSYCLLRPTMIYGSPRDQNIHKLIKFSARYRFFPVFGSGANLLQPLHTEDLATALFLVYQDPQLQGAYDLSGGSIVSFKELINLISQYLGKPVRQISLPLNLGVWSATMLENLLQSKSPVRREQILRLQEDKAFPHDRAKQDFGFSPRTLEVGLKQEIELMRQQRLIS